MAERTNNCSHSSLKELQNDDLFAYNCNGCMQMGYEYCYTCHPQCDYHLHKVCYNAAPKMSHHFFKQGQFVLHKTMLPKNNNTQKSCVACGTIVQGWRYVLTIKDCESIYLHPCCMAMPHQSLRAIHKVVDCVHCEQGNEGVKGWVYVKDGVAVHVKCMNDMMYNDWEDRCESNASRTQDCGGDGGGGNQRRRRRKRDIFLSTTLTILKLVEPVKDILREFA